MGLLKKLDDENEIESAGAVVVIDRPPDNGELEYATPSRAAPQPAAMATTNLPPPMPCLDCGNPILWLDSYDNAHCGQCEPPPARAFVVGKLVLVMDPPYTEERDVAGVLQRVTGGPLRWEFHRGPGRPGG